MTKKYLIYIAILVSIAITHYIGLYDARMLAIILAVIISVLLIGGNHTAMRTYSSMDLKNANYDANHSNDEPSLETILKVCVPLIIFLILVFSK